MSLDTKKAALLMISFTKEERKDLQNILFVLNQPSSVKEDENAKRLGGVAETHSEFIKKMGPAPAIQTLLDWIRSAE